MGKGRTTTGMVICCLVKDIVHCGNHNKEFAFKQVQYTRKYWPTIGHLKYMLACHW